MLQVDENNLKTSVSEFFQNGHTVIDLLNHVLCDKALLEKYLSLHKVQPNSSKLPGLIIQVCLLTSKLFNFNVYGVLNGEITETLTSSGKRLLAFSFFKNSLLTYFNYCLKDVTENCETLNAVQEIQEVKIEPEDPDEILIGNTSVGKSNSNTVKLKSMPTQKKLSLVMPRGHQLGKAGKNFVFYYSYPV